MINIDFIFDNDCPNVDAARQNLRDACRSVGISGRWNEWDRQLADTPTHLRQYGSPTILVDDTDIAGVLPQAAAQCCRVYEAESGAAAGVPSVEIIARALRDTVVAD